VRSINFGRFVVTLIGSMGYFLIVNCVGYEEQECWHTVVMYLIPGP